MSCHRWGARGARAALSNASNAHSQCTGVRYVSGHSLAYTCKMKAGNLHHSWLLMRWPFGAPLPRSIQSPVSPKVFNGDPAAVPADFPIRVDEEAGTVTGGLAD